MPLSLHTRLPGSFQRNEHFQRDERREPYHFPIALSTAVLFIFALLIGARGGLPATAQSAGAADSWETNSWATDSRRAEQDPSTFHQDPGASHSSHGALQGMPERVPEWAAPSRGSWANDRRESRPESPSGAFPRWTGSDTSVQQNGTAQMNGLGSPGDEDGENPTRAPLSGLQWLLVAGVGYAAHRLRNRTGSN